MELSDINQNSNVASNYEPILDPKNERLTTFPLDPKYSEIWESYKKQVASFWTPEEIDFSNDKYDFKKLNENEQNFIEKVLAFFSFSDGIITINLRERFLKEFKITEILYAYSFQLAMENVHAETYSLMLDNIIINSLNNLSDITNDEKNKLVVSKKEKLFKAFENYESIKKIKIWAEKWINSDKSIAHRLIIFAMFEGVLFSSAFAAIFWLKKYRSMGSQFMNGLIKSNDFISRDESQHALFAYKVYNLINNKVSNAEVIELATEAIDVSIAFASEAIQVQLLGINKDDMINYIKYTMDRCLVSLGYNKLYNTENPFPFIETIGYNKKSNFFEARPTEYSQGSNNENGDTNKLPEFVNDF